MVEIIIISNLISIVSVFFFEAVKESNPKIKEMKVTSICLYSFKNVSFVNFCCIGYR